MGKARLPNRPFGPFPTALVGAEVNGKPNYGRAPMIEECSLNFLCRVTQTLPICGFEMFFGQIVAAFANADCLTDGRLDSAKVDPIIMMGTTYWNLAQQIGKVYQAGREYTGPAQP